MITGSVNYKDINFNQEFSASLAASELQKIIVFGDDLSNVDLKAVRSFNITGSSAAISQHNIWYFVHSHTPIICSQ